MPVTTRMSSLNTSSGCVWMMRTYSRIFPRAWLGLFPQLSSSDAAKPPLWRAASELCQPCPHGALVIPKVHPFRIIYPVPTDGRVRIARNPKRLPQLNSSGAWENPIRGERVLHLVNLFNTGCCSLPSPVHSYSSTSSKKWVRVARNQSSWTPSWHSPVPDHLPCQKYEWESRGMRSALYITVW